MGVKNQKKCSYNSSILAGKIDQEGKMKENVDHPSFEVDKSKACRSAMLSTKNAKIKWIFRVLSQNFWEAFLNAEAPY